MRGVPGWSRLVPRWDPCLTGVPQAQVIREWLLCSPGREFPELNPQTIHPQVIVMQDTALWEVEEESTPELWAVKAAEIYLEA